MSLVKYAIHAIDRDRSLETKYCHQFVSRSIHMSQGGEVVGLLSWGGGNFDGPPSFCCLGYGQIIIDLCNSLSFSKSVN